MLPSNPIPQVCDYGTSAVYCSCPDEEQIRSGVVPLDSLPAAWWNWMWSKTNQAVNCARYAAGVLIDEINTVLQQAGVCVCDTCVNQLYTAINNIRQTIGDTVTAGAVKSSSACGEVSINAQGIMTANGLGNAALLTTTVKNAVGAINELKSTYDTCFTNTATAIGGKAPTSHASSATTYGVGSAANYGHLKISDQYTSVLTACSGVAASQKAVSCVYAAIGTCATTLQTNIAGKAPKAHASSATTYGVGSASNYGHLKISDQYTSVLTACSGVAASQKAVACVYDYASQVASTVSALGNTAGCALGTAAAGSATTAARSDHVHPKPTCVACAGKDGSGCSFGTAARYSCSCFRPATWTPSCVACAGTAYEVFDKYGSGTKIGIGYACAGLTCAQLTHFAAFSTNYCSGCTVIKDASIAVVQEALGLGSAAYANLGTMCVACASNANCASRLWDSTGVTATVDGGNEFNIHPINGTNTWINYRGGACGLYIGNGSGTGAYGRIIAQYFCGTLVGCAQCAGVATYANCANTVEYKSVLNADSNAVHRCGTTLYNTCNKYILYFNADDDTDTKVYVASPGAHPGYLEAEYNYYYISMC